MDYNKKGYKIALIALVFAFIALSSSGLNGTNGTNGTSSIMGTLTFSLHNISSDVTTYSSLKMDSVIVADVNKTSRTFTAIPNGQTLLQNWTSLPMGLTLIPAGAVLVHIHALKIDGIAHDDTLNYEIGIVNTTGGNFVSIGVSEPTSGLLSTNEQEIDIEGVMLEKIITPTDRMALRLYVNQTGTGALPDITIYMDDLTISRLVIPAIPIDLTSLINNIGNNTADLNLKVNKTGDSMSGDIIFNDYKGIKSTEIGGITSGFDVTALRSEMYHNGSYLQMTSGGLLTNNNLKMSGNNITNIGVPTKEISGNYTIDAEDSIIFVNPLTNQTYVTLPPASSTQTFWIKNINTGETISNTVGGPTSSSSINGYIQATRILANESITATNLLFFVVNSPAGNGRMALYTNKSTNLPDTLLVESASMPVVGGYNNFTITPTTITAGSYYWLAIQTDSPSASVYYISTGGRRCYTASAYAAFPATYPAASCDNVRFYSGYSNVPGIMYIIGTDNQTIDGNAIYAINSLEHIEVHSNGNNWYIIG